MPSISSVCPVLEPLVCGGGWPWALACSGLSCSEHTPAHVDLPLFRLTVERAADGTIELRVDPRILVSDPILTQSVSTTRQSELPNHDDEALAERIAWLDREGIARTDTFRDGVCPYLMKDGRVYKEDGEFRWEMPRDPNNPLRKPARARRY